MRLYLAGPITGMTYADAAGWRQNPEFVAELRSLGWEPLDPMRGKESFNIEGKLSSRFDDDGTAVGRDLSDIRKSDAILMVLTDAQRVSIGTMCELGYAYALKKPIIVVRDYDDLVHDHLFIEELTTAIVPDLETALHELVMLRFRLREPAYA